MLQNLEGDPAKSGPLFCFVPLGFFAILLVQAPSLAADFSDLRPGAKAMGMGMAFTAIADDPYAMFFNPAGTANTPYFQVGGSVGRMLSPRGPLTFGALTYLRPFERINTATVGSAYYGGRQANGGDKDVFLFHYSQAVKVPPVKLPIQALDSPEFTLSRPLQVGANVKFINIDKGRPDKGRFGLGMDLGLLLRSRAGLSAGLALTDITTPVGAPRPALSVGTAYAWRRRLTASGDLRVRHRLAEFSPGLEASFHQGLLKARLGRGFQLDGVGQLALGLGLNFSPLVLDVAMTLPFNGIHRQGGAYQATLNYRFGAPSFAGSFVGQAASQAEALKAEIFNLEGRKKTLQAEAQAKQTNLEIVEGELRVLEQRVRESQERYRGLQKKKEEAEYGLRETELGRERVPSMEIPASMNKRKPPRAPGKPAAAAWPRKHTVLAGETLRSLSRTYYGDPNLWELIYEANREKVERGLPQEGAVFLIPEPRELFHDP